MPNCSTILTVFPAEVLNFKSTGSVGLLANNLSVEAVMMEEGDQGPVLHKPCIQTVLLHCNSLDGTDKDVSTSLVTGTGDDTSASIKTLILV